MRVLLFLTLIYPALSCLSPPSAHCGEITVAAVGDIMLSGASRSLLHRHGYSYPFEKVADILKGSRITVGNLELPLTDRGVEFTGKRFRFRAPPEAAQALRNAGFSVLTLANNHILDYGADGLKDTLKHLDLNGISHTGAGADLASARGPAIIEVDGKRVAFLAYSLTYPEEFFARRNSSGTAPGYAHLVSEDIRSIRSRVDYLIVSFHWGRELEEKPRQYQVKAARDAIDAGADIVLGHHPHVLQGIERYRKGIIFYSLGNFAFGSSSLHSDRSIIARITLDNGVRGVEIIPLNVLNREVRYQPAALNGARAIGLIERINRLSAGMGVTILQKGGKFLIDDNEKSAVFMPR